MNLNYKFILRPFLSSLLARPVSIVLGAQGEKKERERERERERKGKKGKGKKNGSSKS